MVDRGMNFMAFSFLSVFGLESSFFLKKKEWAVS